MIATFTNAVCKCIYIHSKYTNGSSLILEKKKKKKKKMELWIEPRLLMKKLISILYVNYCYYKKMYTSYVNEICW